VIGLEVFSWDVDALDLKALSRAFPEVEDKARPVVLIPLKLKDMHRVFGLSSE
jgi:hypothetical protein